MGTARVFRSGNSQAVRPPRQFQLKTPEVEISRRGDEEEDRTLDRAFPLLAGLPGDIELAGREKEQPQKRRGLLQVGLRLPCLRSPWRAGTIRNQH
jgi:antitoxin VapB